MITDATRALLGVPETFVDDIGGVTLASWWPAIDLAVTGLSAPVVEIGADRGFTTKALAARCAELGVTFTSIDPNPAPYVDEIASVDHRRSTSKTFFAAADAVPAAGVWIVDGDHNYDTVLMELTSIDRFTEGADAVVFLHDIGWPWGRRNLWYAGDEAPDDAVRGGSVSLDDELSVPADRGIHIGSVQAVAAREGGPRNGVMTAVEDFLAGPRGAGWSFMWSPVFYGFGFLARKSTMDSGKIDGLRELFESLQRADMILGPLEFNRLRLLQTTNIKWTDAASKDSLIAEKDARIAELQQSKAALKQLGINIVAKTSSSISGVVKAALSSMKGR